LNCCKRIEDQAIDFLKQLAAKLERVLLKLQRLSAFSQWGVGSRFALRVFIRQTNCEVQQFSDKDP